MQFVYFFVFFMTKFINLVLLIFDFMFVFSSQSSKVHVTRSVLDIVLAFARYLSNLPTGVLLLKQLCDHILFNPAIWIHAPAKVSYTDIYINWCCCIMLDQYFTNSFFSQMWLLMVAWNWSAAPNRYSWFSTPTWPQNSLAPSISTMPSAELELYCRSCTHSSISTGL